MEREGELHAAAGDHYGQRSIASLDGFADRVRESAIDRSSAPIHRGAEKSSPLAGNGIRLAGMTPALMRPVGFIPTRDAEVARVFYEKVLGLSLESDDQFALVFRLADDVMLRVVRVAEFQPAQFTIFGWETYDIGGSVDMLAANGV